MANRRDAERKRRLLVLRQQSSQALTVRRRTDTEGLAGTQDSEQLFGMSQGEAIDLLVRNSETDDVGQHNFEQPFVLVGRSADCDVRLVHPDVSYRHAYLQLIGGRLLCVDLASRTGIAWGGGRANTGWLGALDPVSIGPYLISRLSEDNQQDEFPLVDSRLFFAESAVDRSFGRVSQFSVFLERQDKTHGANPRRWPIQRPITLVGSSRRCKLRLVHGSVSRVHCSLLLAPGGLWVADLLGKGGTRVDGETVRYTRLDDGSELVIGDFHFRVCYESARTHSGQLTAAGSATSRNRARSGRSSKRQQSAGSAASGRFSESFVLSLVDRFAAMQQQMFSQTQQQMLLLTQMFGSMHESQQSVIREDLIRVHEINREMQQLQSELLRSQAASGLTGESVSLLQAGKRDAAADFEENRGASDSQTALPVSSFTNLSPPEPSTPDTSEDEAEMPRADAETPAAAEQSSAGGESGPGAETESAGDGQEQPDADDVQGAVDECDPMSQAEATGHESAAGDSLAPEPSRRSQTDIDSHAWLNERMAALEKERNSRWQKIMRVLSGSGGG